MGGHWSWGGAWIEIALHEGNEQWYCQSMQVRIERSLVQVGEVMPGEAKMPADGTGCLWCEGGGSER